MDAYTSSEIKYFPTIYSLCQSVYIYTVYTHTIVSNHFQFSKYCWTIIYIAECLFTVKWFTSLKFSPQHITNLSTFFWPLFYASTIYFNLLSCRYNGWTVKQEDEYSGNIELTQFYFETHQHKPSSGSLTEMQVTQSQRGYWILPPVHWSRLCQTSAAGQSGHKWDSFWPNNPRRRGSSSGGRWGLHTIPRAPSLSALVGNGSKCPHWLFWSSHFLQERWCCECCMYCSTCEKVVHKVRVVLVYVLCEVVVWRMVAGER